MPLDRTNAAPMYLMGRLAALAEDRDDRLPLTMVDQALVHPLKALAPLNARIRKLGRERMASEVVDLIDLATLPEGPVKIDRQGDYWLGYYQQRSGDKRVAAIGTDQIARAGEALFGERWQSDLARRLGWDSARVRQVMRGDRPMAGGAVVEILAALRLRSAEAAQLADELEALIGEQADD